MTRSAGHKARAASIAKALGGRKAGGGWTARCPAHDDRTPSLSIREADDNKVLVRCHAGCDQERVIAALRGRGLWAENGRRSLSRMARRTPIERKPDNDDAKRTQAALAIWQSAKPAQGTPVETYLASRGIRVPTPDALRFHAGLKHPSGGIWPVMVALVTNGADGTPIAVHRTFLARDGVGKAPVDPPKMMFGPCRDGAVRLADPSDVLMVGEGIETCLAAMLASGNPAWAALSTSGPARPRTAEGRARSDRAGRWRRSRRSGGAGLRLAVEAPGPARSHRRPPHGFDFNDLLLGRASRIEQGAL